MGIIEISDGVGTRRIRVEDLQGTVQVDCSGGGTTVVVPEETDVDRESATDASADPGRRGRARR